MTMEARETPRIHRRTLARGAAWAVPVIAVAVPARALAASPGDCEGDVVLAWPGWTQPQPIGDSGGGCTSLVEPDADGYHWFRCDATANGNFRVTQTVEFTVDPSHTYSLRLDVKSLVDAAWSGATLWLTLHHSDPLGTVRTIAIFQSKDNLIGGAITLPTYGTILEAPFTPLSTTITAELVFTTRSVPSAGGHSDDLGIRAPILSCTGLAGGGGGETGGGCEPPDGECGGG